VVRCEVPNLQSPVYNYVTPKRKGGMTLTKPGALKSGRAALALSLISNVDLIESFHD